MPRPHMHTERETGTIYLWPHSALYVGHDVAPKMHRHSAAQCAVALDGPLVVRTEDGFESVTEGAVFVDANISHCVASPAGNIALLYLERAFFPPRAAEAESARLAPPGLIVLDAPLDTDLRARLIRIETGSPNKAEASEARAKVLSLFMSPTPRPAADLRVQKVMHHIAEHPTLHPNTQQLADIAGLSPSRLQHLFNEHTGMPIRRYLLWRRIRSVLEAVHGGANLTEAAHLAGFADSAHFSRTFRDMTGITPSDVFGRKPRASITICDD